MTPEEGSAMESDQGPEGPQKLVCPNGHENPLGKQYCGDCGAALQPDQQGGVPPPPPSPGGDRSRRPLIFAALGVAALAVVAVVAIIIVTADEASREITGTMVLVGQIGEGEIGLDDYDDIAVGDPCNGLGGYDDIDQGAQVTVRDGSGTVIGTGNLDAGSVQEVIEDLFVGCEFDFVVADVPDADFYSIEVSHRGEVRFSRQELESSDWTAALSLG